jgi:hypothetical protein
MSTIDSIEVVQDGNKVFGLYRNGDLLIKEDSVILNAVRRGLAESLAEVDKHLSALHGLTNAN